MVDTIDNVNAVLEFRELQRVDPRSRWLLLMVTLTGPHAVLGAIGVAKAASKLPAGPPS